jgi:hypothetical protein
MQQEPVRRPAVRHVDADEVPAAGVDTDAAHPVADVEEPVGDPHHVQGLESPGHDADRSAQVGPARVLVDDPRVQATGQQRAARVSPVGPAPTTSTSQSVWTVGVVMPITFRQRR